MPANSKLGGLVENLGEYASPCGYCASQQDSSLSTGMWAHQLSVEAYQELLDRGWRRSGMWLYKPDTERTCCPPYTIRLDVHKFRMNKVHRRVLTKMDAYLAGGPLYAQPAPPMQPKSAAPAAGKPLAVATHTSPLVATPSVSPRLPDSPSDKRRKVASDTDAPTAVVQLCAEATAAPSGGAKAEVTAALQRALQRCIQSGQLPHAAYPPVRVQEPSSKQRKVLKSAVLFTSPSPFAVAAAACKAAKGTLYLNGEAVAKMLATKLEAGWKAEAAKGHLNISHGPATEQVLENSITASAPAPLDSQAGVPSLSISPVQTRPAELQPPSLPTGWDIGDRSISMQLWPDCAPSTSQAATESDDSSSSTLHLLVGSTPIQWSAALEAASQPVHSITGMPGRNCKPGSGAQPITSSSEGHGHAEPSTSSRAQPDSDPYSAHAVLQHASSLGAHAHGLHISSHPCSAHRHHPYSREERHDSASSAGHAAQQAASRAPGPAALWATLAQPGQADSDQALPNCCQLRSGMSPSTAQQCAECASPVQHGSALMVVQPHDRDPAQPACLQSDPAHTSHGVKAAEPIGGPDGEQPGPTRPGLHGRGQAMHAQQQPQRQRMLRIVLKRSSPALILEEYPLYRRYQVLHHHDPPDQVPVSQFKRFLVDTPLTPVAAADWPAGQSPPCGFGTFHQQYWIDDRLVAVGVVDVLPKCLSSKYFFWDPELAPLSLGKFSALKEIDWVAEAARSCPSLRYYYMGYYIHSCPKMRYKADYAPSDLLCNKRLCWVPYERAQPLLDQSEFSCISDAAMIGLDPVEYNIPAGLQQQQQQKAAGSVLPLSTASLNSIWGVSEAALAATLLLICHGPGRDGRLVQFGQLAMLQAWPREVLQQLRRKLVSWHRLVGKAAERLVYLM